MEQLSPLLKRTEEGSFLSGFQASSNAGGGLYITIFLIFYLLMILFFFVMHPGTQVLHIRMVLISLKLSKA